MSAKLQNEAWPGHRQALPITQVLKFGRTDLMILNAIFGHLVV